MPYYEYRCADCGAELTARQSLSDPALVRCPSCGHDSLKKKISLSGFSIKRSAACACPHSAGCCCGCPHGK